MVIGVDFDNTVISYNELFHKLALDRGLIPASLPATKQHIRDYLRRVGKEPLWTELQGLAYGPHIQEAKPFPGVLHFFNRCRKDERQVFIISHKTQYAIAGPRNDLHNAAHEWLSRHGFYDASRGGLTRDRVYFDLTKQAKLDRIAKLGCTHFIDDLPEFLNEEFFPPAVRKILFDPNTTSMAPASFVQVCSWPQMESMVFD
jgi:hypothetical protein